MTEILMALAKRGRIELTADELDATWDDPDATLSVRLVDADGKPTTEMTRAIALTVELVSRAEAWRRFHELEREALRLHREKGVPVVVGQFGHVPPDLETDKKLS
jgi:hypothetical protein